MDQDIKASWAHGEFTVVRVGAMCAPATFKLSDGREVQPFAVAPWNDDGTEAFAELPTLLKRLRGEWPCIPFGMPEPRSDLPSAWTPKGEAEVGLGEWLHGPGANLPWDVIKQGDGYVHLALEYPEAHPIATVERRIVGDPSRSRLTFDLIITPRRDCRLPIGVHPVLRLPENPGAARLILDGARAAHTYPVDAEPGVSQLPHARRFNKLAKAEWADGEELDLTSHPLSRRTEEIVLVSVSVGRAQLENHEEQYLVSVEWDVSAFPCCNLWISNRGRGYYPWNNRFQALGIEPVLAPFDLGVDVAANGAKPLRDAEVATFQQFRAGQRWSTSYSIEVKPL